jgi:hypothetical protein
VAPDIHPNSIWVATGILPEADIEDMRALTTPTCMTNTIQVKRKTLKAEDTMGAIMAALAS